MPRQHGLITLRLGLDRLGRLTGLHRLANQTPALDPPSIAGIPRLEIQHNIIAVLVIPRPRPPQPPAVKFAPLLALARRQPATPPGPILQPRITDLHGRPYLSRALAGETTRSSHATRGSVITRLRCSRPRASPFIRSSSSSAARLSRSTSIPESSRARPRFLGIASPLTDRPQRVLKRPYPMTHANASICRFGPARRFASSHPFVSSIKVWIATTIQPLPAPTIAPHPAAAPDFRIATACSHPARAHSSHQKPAPAQSREPGHPRNRFLPRVFRGG